MAGSFSGRSSSRLARGAAGLREKATQYKPAIRGAFRETAHEIGAPVGAEGHVDLQGVAGGAYLGLQVAPDSINHLKFVARFVELEPGGFGLGVGDHVPVVGSDGGQETALGGAFEEL